MATHQSPGDVAAKSRGLAERAAGDEQHSRDSNARDAELLDEMREQLDPADTMRRMQIAENHAERLQALAALLVPKRVAWPTQPTSFESAEAELRSASPRG